MRVQSPAPIRVTIATTATNDPYAQLVAERAGFHRRVWRDATDPELVALGFARAQAEG